MFRRARSLMCAWFAGDVITPHGSACIRGFDLILAGAIGAFTSVLFGFFAGLSIDPHHDGIMLKPALDVVAGQTLFRDTFSQYGPLTTYLQAVALSVKPTLLALRWFTVCAYAGSIALLYLAWRQWAPRSLCLVAVVWFLAYAPFYDADWPLLPWSSVTALFFQSLSLLAMARLVSGGSAIWWPWVLGLGCAATFWCRQPVGICQTATAGVIAFALHGTGWRHPLATGRKIWGRAAAGFIIGCFLVLSYLAASGALSAWWEQNIAWPQRWAALVDQSMVNGFRLAVLDWRKAAGLVIVLALAFAPSLVRLKWRRHPSWTDWVWWTMLPMGYVLSAPAGLRSCLLIPYGGWNVVFLGAIVWQACVALAPANWKRTESKSREYYVGATLAGFAMSAAVQIYPVPCPQHIFWAFAPGLIIFPMILGQMIPRYSGPVALILLVVILPAIHEKCGKAMETLSLFSIEVKGPQVLRGMKTTPEQAVVFGRIAELLDDVVARNPDRPAILYGNDALYLVLVQNLENASPYYVEWPFLAPRGEREKKLAYLIQKKPVLFFNEKNPAMTEGFLKVIGDLGYAVMAHEPVLDLWVALPKEERSDATAEALP